MSGVFNFTLWRRETPNWRSLTRASSFGSACFSWLPDLLTGINPRRRVIPFDLQPVALQWDQAVRNVGLKTPGPSSPHTWCLGGPATSWSPRRELCQHSEKRGRWLSDRRVSRCEKRWQNQRVAGAVVTTHAKAPSLHAQNDSVRSSWNDARLWPVLPHHPCICVFAQDVEDWRQSWPHCGVFFFSLGTSWLRFVLTSGLGGARRRGGLCRIIVIGLLAVWQFCGAQKFGGDPENLARNFVSSLSTCQRHTVPCFPVHPSDSDFWSAPLSSLAGDDHALVDSCAFHGCQKRRLNMFA